MMCSSTRNRQIISENRNDIIYVGFELTAVVAVVMALGDVQLWDLVFCPWRTSRMLQAPAVSLLTSLSIKVHTTVFNFRSYMISFLFSDIICLFLVLLHIIYLREPAECAPISSPCKLFYFLAPGVAYLTNLTGLVDRSEGESDRSCSMSKATLVDLWPSMRRTVSLG